MELNLRKESQPFSYWLNKNWYYHSLLKAFYRFVIPPGMRVLHVGCKDTYLLDAVKPSVAVGVDENNLKEIPHGQTFDYVILSSVTMEVYDIQSLFEELQQHVHPSTRIIIDIHSYLWEPILWATQSLGLSRPTDLRNWLSRADITNFLRLANFEVITQGSQILLPVSIPGLSWFANNIIAHIPVINALCLNKWLIARQLPKSAEHNYSTSIVIPCKNERGNIEAAITRSPLMGSKTEFIFVDGHSTDGTYAEIERVAAKYSDRSISYYKQDGKGKGDAVRKGFAHATGDILIILDADLTMPPEELPKFFDALVQGKGEFINGSRLIYGMESQAMRLLNLFANYCFGMGFTWLLGQRIKDTLCGTKVLFRKDYERIVIQRSYFGNFDPFGDFDLLFGAAKLNLKIIDMPVHYKNRTYGTSQIHRFSAGFLLLRMSFLAFKKFKFRS